MRKIGLIGAGFLLAAAIFGVVGFAYAQSILPDLVSAQIPAQPQTTDSLESPYGRADWSLGMNGSMKGGQMDSATGGMMAFGLNVGESGPLHNYLWPAVAESFDLTSAQIEAFEAVREVIKDIREDLTQEEIRETMKQAKVAAIETALAEGSITEKQAEKWLEQLEKIEGAASGNLFGRSGRSGGFRQGFSRGVIFGRQTMEDHEYLDAAIAHALDISVDELQELRSEKSFSLKVYTTEILGLNEEDITVWQVEVVSDAIDAALEDGAITQEQADWVLARLDNFDGRGGWFGQP